MKNLITLIIAFISLSAQADQKKVVLAPITADLPLEASVRIIESSKVYVPGTLKLVVAFRCLYESAEYSPCGDKEMSFDYGSPEFPKSGSLKVPQLTFNYSALSYGAHNVTVTLVLSFNVVHPDFGTIPFGSAMYEFNVRERDDAEIKKALAEQQWEIAETGVPYKP